MASKGFREFLDDLDSVGELRKITKPVDCRQLSALGEQAPEATIFENIKDYPGWRVATALVSTRKRLGVAMGCDEKRIAFEFEKKSAQPIEPLIVTKGACQEVILEGDEVDLTTIPLPMMHLFDGGPYISGTFAVSKDPEFGLNVGCYRLMYRSPRETGIDLVSPSDMRFYYQRAFDQGKPLPIAIAIGVHPLDMLAASYKAPIDTNELALAGGLRGEALKMVKCQTVDLEVPADAEMILEGELLPIGWTADEGPFGEFSQISGDVKWNPIFRIKCITHRKNPIFYMLQMPWENDWLAAPVTEAAGLQALRVASVQPVDIKAPIGGCGFWSLIASIRKRPGEGKNAVAALLSVAEVKHVIVTDDDINIHDPDDLDWAIAFRVQADRDAIILEGARAKHIDPSVMSWTLGKGGLPTTAKLGIDATIPEGVPPILYRRIKNYGRDKFKLEDFE
jgi:2,5-furandicarboxylate decarboxylase 1